jgi:hypothetical protein
MGDVIVARVNERVGQGTVDRIIFRHAGWEGSGGSVPSEVSGPQSAAREPAVHQDVGTAPGPSALPTEEEEVAVAQVRRLGLAKELEESIVRALRASFRRG